MMIYDLGFNSDFGFAPTGSFPIPKGLCPSAQGCDGGATLGTNGWKIPNPKGVVSILKQRGDFDASKMSFETLARSAKTP
jgi:hypothetical protein